MVALCEILAAAGIPVALHGFMDGRDTPPTSGADFLADVTNQLSALKNVSLATLCGRYFAMDRDNNWDRVSLAYNALFRGQGTTAVLDAAMMHAAYEAGENDEFLKPRIAPEYDGVKDGDAVLVANFRADRARELLHAILDEDFDGFNRGRKPALCNVSGMVEYSAQLSEKMPALFPPVEINNTLGDVVARAGKTQLRIAETEKYAHVTFFLNGGEEQVFDGEERILVPSPKVATYDLQPEMSAPEVKQNLIEAIESRKFDLIVVNFANPDMVGHTGVMAAAIEAVQTIDACIGDLQQAVKSAKGTMFITADHGNIELMKDPKTQKPHTAHTTNLVPFLLAAGNTNATLQNGTLADIAPTLLTIMGLQIPADMSGKVLINDPQEDRAVS
jgi:2,3-bisphosphoglycerate-independent phosphoglycerate mutase